MTTNSASEDNPSKELPEISDAGICLSKTPGCLCIKAFAA
jgi:hypothetical protein